MRRTRHLQAVLHEASMQDAHVPRVLLGTSPRVHWLKFDVMCSVITTRHSFSTCRLLADSIHITRAGRKIETHHHAAVLKNAAAASVVYYTFVHFSLVSLHSKQSRGYPNCRAPTLGPIPSLTVSKGIRDMKHVFPQVLRS
jgi:hypothetical protein